MIGVINDVSFQYLYPTAESAVEGIQFFLDICKKLETEATEIDKIKTSALDTQMEIAPNCKLIQLVQRIEMGDRRRYLLSILTNRGTYSTEESPVCVVVGKESKICSQAIDNFLVSLLSNPIFSPPQVNVTFEENEIVLKNISKNEHIEYYRNELGLRKYIANDKKHKFDRENPYGKGKVASRMDLHDEEAQKLLNKAIYIKERLYAKCNNHYYAFQHEGDINFHGYRVDDLGEDIKRQLDVVFAS